MTPMTSPERTYWDRRTASTEAPRSSSALRSRHPVARLELRRVDDPDVGERHLDRRVLRHQHRRRPLLPVRTLAAREADRPVPALERVGQERLDQLVGLVALGGVQRVGQQDDLGVPVEGAVDRILLELGHVLLAERLAPGRQLHRRVVVHDEAGPVALLAQVLPVLGSRGRVVDRKSTRLNSSHSQISYAVFCLKKKKKTKKITILRRTAL